MEPYGTAARLLFGLGGFRFGLDGNSRPVPGALGVDIPVDEFDDRHWGAVAVTEAGLEHAGVAAAALLVARGQHVEQLTHRRIVPQKGEGAAPRVQATTLAKGDHAVGDAAQLLSLGQRRRDLLVGQQRHRHVGKQGFAVARCPVELASAQAMTHDGISSFSGP